MYTTDLMKIASAYRKVCESESAKTEPTETDWKQSSASNYKDSTDDYAAIFAAQTGQNYDRLTNSIPYQVQKNLANEYARRGQYNAGALIDPYDLDSARERIGAGMRYNQKASAARDKALSAIGSKQTAAQYDSSLDAVDREAMRRAGRTGVDFKKVSGSVPYQVGKELYNDAKSSDNFKQMQSGFKKAVDEIPFNGKTPAYFAPKRNPNSNNAANYSLRELSDMGWL